MGVHVEHADGDREVQQRQQGDQRHRHIPVRGGRHQQTEGQQLRAQHAICISGPIFAGCSSFNTRRLKGVVRTPRRTDEARALRVLERVDSVVMCGLLERRCRWQQAGIAWRERQDPSASRGRSRLDGAEGQVIGEHHPAYLGDGQFAGQWFFWQGTPRGRRWCRRSAAPARRHRASVTRTEDRRAGLGSCYQPGSAEGPVSHRAPCGSPPSARTPHPRPASRSSDAGDWAASTAAPSRSRRG